MRTKRFLSIVLTFAMLVGMFPGTSLTTYAEGNATEITPTNTSGTMNITLTIAAHVHDDITFKAWTATDSMPTEAGNYYLANDVTIGSTWNVPTGTTNLCLNGHAIKSTGDHRMMEVGAGVTLSLYDEGAGVHKYTLNGDGLAVVDDNATGENVKTFEGGYLTGAYASNLTGACVLVKDGGIFNMHGGTMIGNYAAEYAFGGAVSVQASRFEMTGGKMIGNVSMHGAVDTRGGGDGFIMKGGEISYNTASNQGGAVCMGGGGIATISGGKITNNIALGNPDGSSESGGIVFRSGASALNISGNPIIKDNVGGDIYLWSGKKINVVGELTNEASIGITIKPATGTSGYASGVFTNSSDTSFNIVGAFFSNSQDYAVGKNADGQLFLGSPIVTLTYDGNGATGGNVPAETTGYASGSAITVPGNTNSLVKTGLVFDGWNTMADGSGTAYAADQAFTLTANTTLYAQWKIVHVHDDISFTAWTATNSMPTEAGNYYLANDVTISSTWNVPSGTTNLCLNGHGIIMSGTNRVITVASGRTLNLYDCGTAMEHKFTVTNPSDGGAGLATVNDSLESGYQTFTGGYITGGNAGQGGGVYVAGGTFHMAGGNIIGNKATASGYYDGGGVFLSAGSRFVMTGGAIQYNTSVGRGGGLGIVNDATVELSGDAKITYNRSNNNDWGGGISSFGTLNISGNVKISNNKGGSALHPQQGSLTISGAPVIFDNEVTANILPDVKINVTGTLTEGAKLGIYLGNGGVFTDSSDTTYNDASKFVSDNPNYSVMKNADGQLYLGYTVTFDACGHGTAPDAQTVVPGSKLTRPTDPTAEGYAFDGWYKEEALTNEWDFDSDTVTGNITLYAKWRQEISYIVTFKVINGKWDDDTTADKTVTLNGYEGDELKLAENQIPAVGSKPSATYKAGSWNVTPSTTTVISAATTYTYTYAQKASITPTVSMDGWTYGETAKTPRVNGNTGNGAVTYTYAKKNTTSFSATVPSDAGEYTIKAVIAETDNYMAGEATTDFTIARANAAATAPTANTMTYNGQDQALVSGGEAQGGTLQYAIGTSATTAPTTGFGTAIPSGKTAGTYYVWYKVVGDGNHNDLVATTPVTAEIAKAAINITADDKSTQYGADIAELTYAVSGAYVTGDDLGVTVSTTATNASLVNTYPISISWNNNANYTATLTNGTYTITKADLTVSASGYSGTYDEQAHGISVDVGNSGATVYYGTAELTEQNYSNAGSTTNPTYTDAGTYTVYYYVTATNYDPQPVKGSQTVTIARANVEVTMPSAATLTYDGSDRALVSGGSVTGGSFAYALGENGTTAPTGDHAWNAGVPTGKNAGTYYVWYKGVGDGNHNDSNPACITVTIGKKDATINANAVSKTYGDADPTLTANVNGAVGTEALQYTLSRTAGNNVGSYAISVNVVADANPNYDITVNGSTFTINKKSATITADAASKTYGDADPALTATVTGTVGNDTLSYTLNRTEGNNVGSYTISVTAPAADNPNYDITVNSGTFTINKKALTITADSAAKVYDTTALTRNAYTSTDLATGDGIESVTITGTQTAVGNSANVPSGAVIKQGGTDVTANYEITYANGTLTVTRAATNTVTVDITGWTYGDSANAPTSEADFGANTVTYSYSDAQDGTYTATVPVNAGTWYVKASVAGTENYVAGEATKSFTIAKRELVISNIVAEDKDYDGNNAATLDFSYVIFGNSVPSDAGKLTVTATGTFDNEKVGKGKTVTIAGLTLGGEAASNYVLATAGQQTAAIADVSEMKDETNVPSNFVAKVKDFAGQDRQPAVTGLDLALATSLCTPAELAAYGMGDKLELSLEISKAGSLMTDDAVTMVTNALKNDKGVKLDGAAYYDVSLNKKVGAGPAVKVTDLNGSFITVTMDVPEDMHNHKWENKRTYYVVRIHAGAAQVIAETTDLSVTFSSDKFSVYAICYADSRVVSYESQSSSASAGTAAVAPKTYGVSASEKLLVLFGTAAAVVGIVTGVYAFRRRKEEEE